MAESQLYSRLVRGRVCSYKMTSPINHVQVLIMAPRVSLSLAFVSKGVKFVIMCFSWWGSTQPVTSYTVSSEVPSSDRTHTTTPYIRCVGLPVCIWGIRFHCILPGLTFINNTTEKGLIRSRSSDW